MFKPRSLQNEVSARLFMWLLPFARKLSWSRRAGRMIIKVVIKPFHMYYLLQLGAGTYVIIVSTRMRDFNDLITTNNISGVMLFVCYFIPNTHSCTITQP